MAPPRMLIKFLGTSSMPNATRNYSSLLLKVDNFTVMVDCGESTQRQLQARYIAGDERLANLRMILVTHLHADHVLGIVPLIMSMMGSSGSAAADDSSTPRVEIFGPHGLRALIRTTLTLCYSQLSGKYVVHEFVWPTMPSESNSESQPTSLLDEPRRGIPNLPPHESELPGRDIYMDTSSASWPAFTSFKANGQAPQIHVSAAPITHRCPTVGYVFDEEPTSSPLDPAIPKALNENSQALREQRGIRNALSLIPSLVDRRQTITLPDGRVLHPPALDIPGRKVTILGDTSDATGGFPVQSLARKGMVGLATGSDVLVHESTNIALPASLNRNGKADSFEDTLKKAQQRGHSTPQGAGIFAALINARALILNHFSVKYPAPPHYLLNRQAEGDAHETPAQGNQVQGQLSEPERRLAIMNAYESQAGDGWKKASNAGPNHVIPVMAAYDGFTYEIPARAKSDMSADESERLDTNSEVVRGHAKEITQAKEASSRYKARKSDWDPSPYLLPNAEPTEPYAVILLNCQIDERQRAHFLRIWTRARVRLCADGAANRLVEAFGFEPWMKDSTNTLPAPQAIVGDLDSIRPEVKEFFIKQGVDVQVRPSQYATDLQKCIQAIEDYEVSNKAKEMALIVFGGLAGRLDQSIHTLHVLWQLAPGTEDLGGVEDPGEADQKDKRGGKLRKRQRTFVIGDGSVAWLLPKGKHQLRMSRQVLGKTCGILPLGTGLHGAKVTTKGLEWDLSGEASTLGGFLSTSNHLADPLGAVEVDTDEHIYWTVELQPSQDTM